MNKYVNDIDETLGKKFNRLLVLKIVRKSGERTTCLCRCDCGKKKMVLPKHLRSGNTKSCGCWKRESAVINGRKAITHNLSNTPIYRAYYSILTRCYNSNGNRYKYYGGYGIGVFKPWRKSFRKFYKYVISHIGPKPGREFSIDRIDGNRNYEPGNIRWATATQQNRNRKNSFPSYIYRARDTMKRWKEVFS